MGWWRGVGYSGLAWYAIDDLIAEIRYAARSIITLSRYMFLRVLGAQQLCWHAQFCPTTNLCIPMVIALGPEHSTQRIFLHREETSNNRIRSGPKPKRAPRPIDQVPAAGARQGLSNGTETTHTGLGIADPEDPERSPGARPLSLNINVGGPSRTLSADAPRTSWSSGAEPGPGLRRSPSAMSHVELLSPHQRHATGS